LALENHPDRNPDKAGAEAKIKEINAAYECLSDDKKKQEYDLNGKLPNFGSRSNFNFKNFGNRNPQPDMFNMFFNEPAAGRFGGASCRGRSCPMDIDEDFLKQGLYGKNPSFNSFSKNTGCNGRKRQRKASLKKGETCQYDLCMTLEDLYNGKKKKMKINRKRCQTNGTYKEEPTVLTIDVKKGWKEGTKVTFHGEGPESDGYSAGDVVFVIKEISHERFKREGADLIFKKEISLKEAIGGGTINVVLLSGETFRYNFTPLRNTTSTKRIKDKGMPISKTPGTFGDLQIKFDVSLPTGKSRNKIISILDA